MHHISCPHDRSSFASLVHILGSLQLHSSVEPLRANGVRSAIQLENTPKHQLRLWIGDPAIDRLFNRSVVRAQSRAEAPVVHPYQRGSRQAAAAVQGEGALAKADEAFQEDKFAKSSRGPRESRWKLWCSLAEQRNLPPLPVTVDLIDKVGALLKQARYRSAAQYYSVAKSEHRAHGYDWPASLDHAVAQAVRSITRGMGPSSAKLDFPLEVCSRSFEGDVVRAYSTLQVPEHARIEAPADTGIVASWFLLRGLEISSVVCEDIAFARDTRYALTTLHSGVQFDFDSRVDGTPRRLCSATGRVPPLSYRSSGWPACSPGFCARATSEIGLVRFSSGGHNTPLGSQALNCSPEQNSSAGAAQQSAATCKKQPWQIPQGRHKQSLAGRQLYPRVLSRHVRRSWRSFRPRSTKSEQWSRIALEAKGSLYITFGRSWHISRVPPSVRRLRATGFPPAVGGSMERRVVSGTLPCYQAFVTARCASLRRVRSLKCSSPRTWPLRGSDSSSSSV